MYWLGKASHFNNLKRVIFGPIGDQELGNARKSHKVKSGVSQIHLWQLFQFITVLKMQLLSATKFVISKISTNRPKQKIFVYKVGSKGEFFLK